MARLPVISGAKAVRAFEKAGWRKDRRRGSHVVMLQSDRNDKFVHSATPRACPPARCGF